MISMEDRLHGALQLAQTLLLDYQPFVWRSLRPLLQGRNLLQLPYNLTSPPWELEPDVLVKACIVGYEPARD